MAFDEHREAVVMFGGIGTGDRSLDDTWTFDGTRWTKLKIPGPSKRRYAALGYHPELRGCVLHGGSEDDAGKRQFNDTWLLRDDKWTRLAPGFGRRDDHTVGFHPVSQEFLMLDTLHAPERLGVLNVDEGEWDLQPAAEMPPPHQCSPWVWDETQNGLVMHGGERKHGGPNLAETRVLRYQS